MAMAVSGSSGEPARIPLPQHRPGASALEALEGVVFDLAIGNREAATRCRPRGRRPIPGRAAPTPSHRGHGRALVPPPPQSASSARTPWARCRRAPNPIAADCGSGAAMGLSPFSPHRLSSSLAGAPVVQPLEKPCAPCLQGVRCYARAVPRPASTDFDVVVRLRPPLRKSSYQR